MTDTLDKMLNALRGSVASIDTAPAEKRSELLNKSFEDFHADVSGLITGVAQEAFDCGIRGDLRKFVGSDDPEISSYGHVAETAHLMRSVDAAIESMTKSYDEKQLTADVRGMLAEWTNLGKGILNTLTADYVDEGQKAPTEAEKAEAAGELKKRADVLKSAVTAMRKRAQSLFKDDGTGGDDGSDDPSQMDPLEVIGRLAAAILVQIDALMPDSDEGSDQDQPGSQPGSQNGSSASPDANAGDQPSGAGATPPPMKKPPVPPANKADGATDLAKGADDLTKRQSDLDAREAALKEREDKLGKQAADGKGSLKVVGKEADDLNKNKVENIDEEAERLSKLPEGARTTELMKRSLRRPVVVL